MYQVGIRLHDVRPGTIEERVVAAKEQGFKCAHIALSKLISEYSTDDSALTPGFAMYLKKLFARNDLDIAVMGCYLNLATPDKDELRRTTERYKAHLTFASLLGCGVVGTETGAPNTEYRFDREACYSEKALDIFTENLKPVVEYAEKMGVLLAIEPVCRHIVHSPERARKVLDRIASPNLKIIFDPVNLIDTWNYRDREAIFDEAIELLGRDIAIVHVKDFNIVNGKQVCGAVGTGIMDYTGIVEFLKREKPYIQCTLEDTIPKNALAAREFFEGLATGSGTQKNG